MPSFFISQPQNILLTKPFPDGEVKICDLGFACLTNTGEDIRDIIGTPDYVGKQLSEVKLLWLRGLAKISA